MRNKLKEQIMSVLTRGQLSHSDLCERCDASLSTVNLTLRELIESKQLDKMRVGRNVYYAISNQIEPKFEKHINHCILTALSAEKSLTLCELSKRCPHLSSSEISKSLAKLVFTSKVYKHAKEKSRHIHYSTSNFVEGLLLVNPKRRKLNELSDNVIGPYLRQFLFNQPIIEDDE